MQEVPAGLGEFIAAVPKAELHLHLVGSAALDTVLRLAQRHPDGGVPTEAGELARFYEFSDFAHFVDTYAKVDALVRTPQDVSDLVLGAARDAARSSVRYCEVTVTSGMHLQKGIPADELCEVLASSRQHALAQHGVELAYIHDLPAGFGLIEQTVDFATRHRPEGTVALGLAGLEHGYPRADFLAPFQAARAAGLHVVAHAGETTGPGEVRAAMETLGAERIGHGIGAAADPDLLQELAARGTPLEICPTSNVCTKAVADLDTHPLPKLVDIGVAVTINTDDPAMFHTDLNTEYAIAAALCRLDAAGIAELARAAVRHSFCSPETAQRILTEIDSMSA